MLSWVRLVVGRPQISLSFTDSLPSRNHLCHSKIAVRLNAASTVSLLNQFHSLCSRKFNFTAKFNRHTLFLLNLLKPNDIYICRTAALTSRHYILNIYSTNIHTEYFKHAAQSPFFSLQNAVYFIMLPCLVPILIAFYLQGVLKFKCKIPAPKG